MKQRIILAISGGIAAYKCPELLRLLVKQGIEVRIVMTQAAEQFVTPLTLHALSGFPVFTHATGLNASNAMEHIELARWADALVIAPATANILAKLSYGLADDLLSALYLAVTCPVYVAPAMNQAMWHKTITQHNVRRLKRQGVKFIGPESGAQACGDVGVGRMAEPETICQVLLRTAELPDLRGKKILITAGPTREPLDPVRYITNRSSGKMGYALANAAVAAGANVVLISGPVALRPPNQAQVLNVETAAQMYQAVMNVISECDIFIGAAAVADYTPQLTASHKIKKHTSEHSVNLSKTQDILAAVAQSPNRPFCVGFAAETENLEAHALAKLHHKQIDMIAANWVGRAEGGFEADQNALQVFWPGGQHTLDLMDKTLLAEHLLQLIITRYQETYHAPHTT